MQDVDKKLEYFIKIKEDISPRREAKRIILIYLLLGGLWIVLSDRVAAYLFTDVETLAAFSTWKGWFYVIVTGYIFYRIIRRSLKLYQNAVETIFDNYKGLGFAHKELIRTEQQLQKKYQELDESIRASKINEMRLDLAVAGAKDGIWEWDIQKDEYRVSERWILDCGYDTEDLPSSWTQWLRLIHADDANQADQEMKDFLEGREEAFQSVYRIRCRNGLYRTILSKGVCVRNENGEPARMAGSHSDITAELKLHKSLREEQELSDNIIDESPIMVLLLSPDWTILRANEHALEKTGYRKEEVEGRKAFDFVPKTYEDPLMESYKNLVTGERVRALESEIYTKDQQKLNILWNFSLLHDENEETRGIILSGTDITGRKEMESKLYERAYYDFLTGLPNRALLLDTVQEWLTQDENPMDKMALIYVDVDNFKHINEIHGHHVGDQMLKYLGLKISENVQNAGISARLGGDEFAIALKGADEAMVQYVLDCLLEDLQTPWIYEENAFYIQISAGVVMYPKDGTDVESLFRRMDLAAFEAKEKGKNRTEFYHSDMEQKSHRFVQMENWIRSAISNQEFAVHYQPQVNMKTGEIIKMEALIRWDRPNHGIISPVVFIPVAEQTGHMEAITTWVLREASRQKKAWEEKGIAVPTISINLSSVHLSQGIITDELIDEYKEGWREPGSLELEITEAAILYNEGQALEQLKRLKKRGITIALDDFGTGYSSLTHLQKLPIDTLKVDRSFLLHVLEDPRERSLYMGVVNLAHDLGLRVVAEGVETKEQVEFLLSNHCILGQGYYFSKVLPPEEMETLLRQGSVVVEKEMED
ncbi:EAL domain-containing protein [Alkalibacter rhizosphaerae]|uniref:EAL domain-containing protein n=1 Tax=Alkalibacter rhizosphaerae TaxID=2815577 RepID=A0A974XGM0_9FIRM|nr:GGDEF domain-containing phosphodiesterase [Alkalibacter rhizosphaerae]QSX07953.1 EAL domain-containing protein [Alkalibacter rhizosphaerae]